MKYTYIILFAFAILLSSCTSTKPTYFGKTRKIVKSIEENPIFKDHFTGFVLYDLANKKKLIDINGDKYFTPASNTKIITFYTAINILGDSMPVLSYQVVNDTVIFQGTGNPLFLNPFLNDTSAFSILKDSTKMLLYNSTHNENEKYGSGWAWDDASYSYQPEITPMPIFGNLDSDHPISFSDSVFAKILSDTLHQKVSSGKELADVPKQLINIAIPDSLYILLLHESDNHIAEQLLVMSSFKQFGKLNTKEIIKHTTEAYYSDLKNSPRWVDGSGLSRYNLFTPNTFIFTLEKIHDQIGLEQIKILFPSGGKGTLKGFYAHENGPYIFAKTGTLSNNHNFSGYLITKKGHILIFSFMHNHYIYGSKKVKKEMEKVFREIYERF